MTRRVAVAAALALTAGVAATLALDDADRAYGRPGAAILIALTAAWIGQGITPLIRRRTR